MENERKQGEVPQLIPDRDNTTLWTDLQAVRTPEDATIGMLFDPSALFIRGKDDTIIQIPSIHTTHEE